MEPWSKEEMTAFDVRATARELNALLEGARFDKVYRVGKRELKIKVHVPEVGTHFLAVEPGKRVHVTWRPKPSPKVPDPTAQALRNVLTGDVIESVEQLGFDRILAFSLRSNRKLYIEIIPGGCLAVVDEDGTIEQAFPAKRFRDRAVVPGERYETPPSPPDPYELDEDSFLDVLRDSDRDLVRALAVDVGLGGLYAEETLLRAGLEDVKHEHPSDVPEENLRELYETLRDLLDQVSEGELTPTLYSTDEGYVDVTPVPLERYLREGLDTETEDTFQRALDRYYVSKFLHEKREEARKEWEERKRKVERTLEKQKETVKAYRRRAEDLRRRANALYLNYDLVERVLNDLRKLEEEGHSLEEIKRRLHEVKSSGVNDPVLSRIVDVDPRERRVLLRLDDGEGGEVTVPVPVDSNVHAAASELFDKAKELERKAERAEEVMKEKESELRKLEEEGPPEVELEKITTEVTAKRRKDWYERFRWFISTDGFVVIGGYDARTNEIILRRYLEEHDILVHAHVHGAPHVVIKTEGREVPETTIEEAATFAAAYSRAWRWGLKAVDVYWVTADQVDKSAEAPRGGAIIRGKRNWLRGVELEAAVGVEDLGENGPYRVMGGPPRAVKKRCEEWAVLEPGEGKKSDVAKEVFEGFKKRLPGLRKWITVDDVVRAMPPGRCRIVESSTR
ncbi:MAG: fibronectin-binding domain-containing protein [Methanopyri archaeon]|nr:fibronectin-binding domain-containing protein [Methanopyri archaeon]